MSNPTLALSQIYSNGKASLSYRWNRCDFLDKEVFAQSSVAPQYWPGFGLCLDLPGLPTGTLWDGVLAYQGHLMGYQGSTITWSDVNDFTNFIPVPSTIQDVALTLANNFTQLAPGVETGWVFVNENTAGMVPDMFIRIDYPPYYNFYTVNAVSLTNGVSGTSAPFDQSVPVGQTKTIFTQTPFPIEWASATTTPGVVTPATADTIGFLEVEDSKQPLTIAGQSSLNSLEGVFATGFTAPAIGGSVNVVLNLNPGWIVGDYLSVGGDGTNDAESLCLDIYEVNASTPAIADFIQDATSSLTSNAVTSAFSSLPTTLKTGAIMLGQQVTAISGTSGAYTITLSGNANAAITAGSILFTINPTLSITRQGIGSNQLFAYPAGTNAVTQPYVTLLNDQGPLNAYIPAGSSLVEAYGLKLTLSDFTGALPAGQTFIGGSPALSLNANEAGQLVNAGDRINGPIWGMTTSGLYAVIMKERSFQSIQYVGLPGIFNIWPEFTDEGLIGRNCWCKVGENTIYFWGHRAFFSFASGQGDPTPIGQKHFVQVLKEIDRTRTSECCMFHKEDRREVWFVYPLATASYPNGPSRVFIYNYEQGTVSIDDYADAGVNSATYPITAVGALPAYTEALQWQDWIGSWQDQLMAWNDLTGNRQFLTLMALYPQSGSPLVATPQLVAHGSVYDRNGVAYKCCFETVFHDCGDEQAYKYLDLIQFSLSVIAKQITGRPFRLYAQAGTRQNFDGDTTWATPQFVDVSGNANFVTKLNFKMAARFIGIRWYSDQADCQWRIASYTISGRLGNTY